jgi:nucleoside-diphosphate-sugar epimerase
MEKILVTGASGFIGERLFCCLKGSGKQVLGTVRLTVENLDTSMYSVGCISGETKWEPYLDGVSVIIHTAGLAHLASINHDEYEKTNVLGTYNLAQQAAAAGVKRFIFLSTIGVNGNMNNAPFCENDEPNPIGVYAESKLNAENALWKVQCSTDMDITIIRPPLVYGPNAPGNFGSLVRWIEKGIPLPLGAIHNQRSLVAVDNLIDLIITCMNHPAAANQVFLAGDGQDLSTSELLRCVAKEIGVPARLIPLPTSLLMIGAALLGKKVMAQQLLGSLQVDISKARNLLGWKPPVSVEEGLKRCFK